MNDTSAPLETPRQIARAPDSALVATLAGGCFWCMEGPFQSLQGVYGAVSGYAGGDEASAKYSQVSTGKTNHREAVQVFYDPEQVTYAQLLDVFWRQIDPTDAGGQFADRGFQYTTAIFYHNAEQQAKAELALASLAQSGKFDQPLATAIEPFSTFFPAEEYHQDYYLKAKDHYERYKQASGRADYISDNWAKDAALEASQAE